MRARMMKRWLISHLLPEFMADRLWRWHTSRTPRSALPTTSDHRVITIQEGVSLDIFWVCRKLGPGPGASLYVLGDEVLRLDCFGNQGLGGHYHINPRQTAFFSLQSARLYFPLGSHEDHIEHAAFEVERNLPAVLTMNRDARIRKIELDSVQLTQVANDLRRIMLELLERHRDELMDGRQLESENLSN